MARGETERERVGRGGIQATTAYRECIAWQLTRVGRRKITYAGPETSRSRSAHSLPQMVSNVIERVCRSATTYLLSFAEALTSEQIASATVHLFALPPPKLRSGLSLSVRFSRSTCSSRSACCPPLLQLLFQLLFQL